MQSTREANLAATEAAREIEDIETMSDVRLITVGDPEIEVVVFTQDDGGAKVALRRRDYVTVINVDSPPDGQRIAVVRYPNNTVDIIYRNKP